MYEFSVLYQFIRVLLIQFFSCCIVEKDAEDNAHILCILKSSIRDEKAPEIQI